MLAEYKTKTNIGVGLGIILQVLGKSVANTTTNYGLAILLVLAGAVFFIWGCMNYAQGKGHSKWLGLLGLISCIGLIILVCLPDHHKGR